MTVVRQNFDDCIFDEETGAGGEQGLGKAMPFSAFCDQPTTLVKVPISSMEMRISSDGCNVNASGGTMPVPVSKKQPDGKMLSRNRYSTRVLGSRFMLSRLVAPRNTQMFSREISSSMLVELFNGCSRTRIHGPNAQLRL
jgi:hypothetical protein